MFKVNNKDTIGVILMSLLLTLNMYIRTGLYTILLFPTNTRAM